MTEPALRSLIEQFFAAVSFPEGGAPHYDHIRDLFVPEGLLIKNSGDTPEISGLDAFIAPRQELFDAGRLTAFEEVEVAARTDAFGNVAHRLSTYEKRGVQDGAAFAATGIITTQFIATPDGWRMSAMAWDDERPGRTVPAEYLTSPGA
jgi:hypothetical protein